VVPLAALLLGTVIMFSPPATATARRSTAQEFGPAGASISNPASRPELALISKVRSFASKRLSDNGVIPEQAIDDAESLLWNLVQASLPLPELRLDCDGEINCSWKRYGVHIDLGFYGTGTFSYYARAADGSEHIGDDLPIVEGLPAALAALLRS
jgi:hypothetical protein